MKNCREWKGSVLRSPRKFTSTYIDDAAQHTESADLVQNIIDPRFRRGVYISDNTLSLHQKHLLSTAIFWLAAITDWLDGYLARALDQGSAFGAFLDPVADKLMVAAALIVLVKLNLVDVFIAFIIIGREITISALREWMAQLGNSKSVAVSMLGKCQDSVPDDAILFLLYQEPLFGISTLWWGTLLVYRLRY